MAKFDAIKQLAVKYNSKNTYNNVIRILNNNLRTDTSIQQNIKSIAQSINTPNWDSNITSLVHINDCIKCRRQTSIIWY